MTETLISLEEADIVDGYWVAVDLGGTQIRTALFTEHGEMLRRHTVATPSRDGRERVLATLTDEITQAVAASVHPVKAIAVSALGPVEPRTGVIRSAPTIVDFSNVPLAATLQDRLGLPVHVVNDANAATVAEWRLGSGRGTENFCFVTVSTGIGCGLVLNGQLVEGEHGAAGEFGRTRMLDREGEVVTLESIAAGHGLSVRAVRAIAAGRSSALAGHHASGQAIADAASAGDPLACELMHAAAAGLGLQLGNLTRLVDPQRIAIGGGISKAGAVFWTPLLEVFEQSLTEDGIEVPSLVPAELAGDAGLHGAALELQRIYAATRSG